MKTLISAFLTILPLIPWSLLWALGGITLARAAFRLGVTEEILVGITIGWVIENWLANLLVWFMPLPLAFYTAAGLVFLVGVLALALVRGKFWSDWRVMPGQLLVYAVLIAVFFMVSRGLAIFDDFAHLPTVSIMAAGDIPPHFSFDPSVWYGYHHFLLLFSAQIMRLTDMPSWQALDASRALTFSTAVMLGAIWTRRLVHSQVAGLLGGMMVAFGSGARWLLLFLPHKVNLLLGKGLDLQGSGSGSGKTLAEALSGPWAVQGMGKIPFPFAFANGIYPAGVLGAMTANGLMAVINILLLLLTCNRWRNRLGGLVSVILLSVWGLLGEAELPAIVAGVGIVVAVYAIRHNTIRLPRLLWAWIGIIAAGTLIAFLEGGTYTDLLRKTVERIYTGTTPPSYQTVGFVLTAPALVSSHLGPLWLYRPMTIILALLELGPLVLGLPLLLAWGYKAYRAERWYEAGMAGAALFSLLMVFVQFSGSTGVRNTPRLYFFMPLCALFSVPLVWMWVERRSQRVKAIAGGLGAITMLGGLVMGGIGLVAGQHPVSSYYLISLDERMEAKYWNRLEPGTLIFDSVPERATALFGRPTNSSYSWYATKSEWDALVAAPDPYKLRAAGYRYAYFDNTYWDSLAPVYQQALSGPCVRQVEKLMDEYSVRRLFDLENCR